MKQKILLVAAAIMCCTMSFAKTPKQQESYNYKRGVEALKDDKLDEGIRFLNQEVEEHPKNGYAYAWLASAYAKKDENGSALYGLEQAIKYLPKKEKHYRAWSYSLKSDILLQMQDTAAAIDAITQSIKIQPTEEDWLYQRSQIYMNLKQFDLSNADLRQYIKLTPGIITGYIHIGLNYLAQEQYEKALEEFIYAHKLAKRPFTYAFMAQAQIKLHQYESAATNLIESLKLDVNNNEAGDAVELCKCKECVDALLPLIDAQIALHPNDYEWLAVKTYILNNSKRYAEAIEVLKQAKQLSTDPFVDGGIAYFYTLIGDNKNALKYANAIVEADTTNARAYSIRMDIYYDMDSIILALADAYKMEQLAPDDEQTLCESGQMYFFAGHYRRAILKFNTILAMNPKANYFRYLRGRAYLALGEQPSLADADFNRAYKESSRGITRAFSLCFLDRFDEARAIVDSVCIADSIDHEERYNAACVYALIGDESKALQLLEDELKDGYVKFNHIRHDPDMQMLPQTRLDSLLNIYEVKMRENLEKISQDSTENVALRVVEVPFTASNGVTKVDCTINGLPLNFIFDTGASDVTISQTEANFMFKNGYLSQRDIVGKERYQTADGNVSVGTVFVLNHINFGGLELTGVRASVVGSQKAPLLLGQTVLKRLGKIEIDNERRVLKITTNQ